MRDPRRYPCSRCAVVGPHAGAVCRRCATLGGVKFELAPRPADPELLPDSLRYGAALHQAGCAIACAVAAFAILAQEATGGAFVLFLLSALRFDAMRRTLRREATGWWTLVMLALFDLPAVFMGTAPLLIAWDVATLALIAPRAVRCVVVEPPAHGVPADVEMLRMLHVVLAALLFGAGMHWRVPGLARLLALAAAAAQLAVPPLVIGCGGRGWRWWVALCAADLAGGLIALTCSPVGLLCAALGAGGVVTLLSDEVRAWGHRGRAVPPAGLALLASVSLVVRGLIAAACALALAGDPGLVAAWAGLAYVACGVRATLGTLAGDRRCWVAWRAANVLDAAGLIALAAFGWWAAEGGAALAYGFLFFASGTGVACMVANRLLDGPEVQCFAAPSMLPGRRRLAPR